MNIHGLKFHNKLLPEPLNNGKDWALEKWYAVTFYLDNDPQKYLIFIPSGYITDFGSIPRIAWPIIGSPATGRHRRGTVFHDWIFVMHSQKVQFANEMFRAIMRHDKTPKWKEFLIYWAVQTAGRISWWKWNDKYLVTVYQELHDEQLTYLPQFSDCRVYA